MGARVRLAPRRGWEVRLQVHLLALMTGHQHRQSHRLLPRRLRSGATRSPPKEDRHWCEEQSPHHRFVVGRLGESLVHLIREDHLDESLGATCHLEQVELTFSHRVPVAAESAGQTN